MAGGLGLSVDFSSGHGSLRLRLIPVVKGVRRTGRAVNSLNNSSRPAEGKRGLVYSVKLSWILGKTWQQASARGILIPHDAKLVVLLAGDHVQVAVTIQVEHLD